MSNKVCYCDLDGVFTCYPKCWLEFIRDMTGKHYESLEQAKKGLFYADYVNLKNNYRGSSFKYNLTAREGSSAFTKSLKEQGWFVVLVTTRPNSYPQLLIRTIRWLDKNNILFDDILFLERDLDILTRYPNFVFGVQDDPQVCTIIARMGYKMFLIRNENNFDSLHENVIIVDRLEDIIGRISNWV